MGFGFGFGFGFSARSATHTPVPRPKRLFIYGNSITFGQDASDPPNTAYAGIVKSTLEAQGWTVTYLGHPGFGTDALLPLASSEVDSAYDAAADNYFIIYEVLNDCGFLTAAQAAANIRRMCEERTAVGWIPIAATTYQVDSLGTQGTTKVAAANTIIRADYTEYAYALADIETDVPELDGGSNPTYSDDAVHPTDAGHALIAAVMLDAIAAAVTAYEAPAGTATVSSVTPSMGFRLASGLPVEIFGAGFKRGATASIDGVACTDVVVMSPSRITCTTGTLSSDGQKDVVVTNTGQAAGTLASGYWAMQSARWLDTSDASAVTLVSSAVSQCSDKSGNGRHRTQGTAGDRPTLEANGGVNWARYLNNHYMVDPTYDGLTQAELFAVMAADGVGLAAHAPWNVGSDVFQNYVPFADGHAYDGWGSTTRRDLGVIAGLTVPHVYNVVTKAGEWTLRVNGTQVFTDATNTVGFDPAGCIFGGTSTGGLTPANFYDGRSGEEITFATPRTPTERAAIKAYLAAKWGTP